jgi:hypothetical protein
LEGGSQCHKDNRKQKDGEQGSANLRFQFSLLEAVSLFRLHFPLIIMIIIIIIIIIIITYGVPGENKKPL